MLLLLAQASVSDLSNAELRAWIVGLVILLLVGVLWKTLFQRTPSLTEEFVTRREYDRHVSDVKEKLQSIEDKGEARVIRIYAKIEEASERQTERLITVIQQHSK